ncbi:MAG: hypothetical protein V8Q54_09910 [Alistipes senegalensis]
MSIHEEMPYGMSGRAFPRSVPPILLGWAKEMGCNLVRLAHYPHNEAMVRAAEEMGLMVWWRMRSTGRSSGESRDLCRCRSAAGGHDHATPGPAPTWSSSWPTRPRTAKRA